MRPFLGVLIFLVLVGAPEIVRGMEAILGTVEAVRSDTGEVVLRVAAPVGDREAGDTVLLRFDESLDPQTRAAMLVPGSTLRVWGEFLSNAPDQFLVRSLRGGPAGRRGGDPTGVRSRLGRRPFSGRQGGRGGHGGGGGRR